MNDPKKYPVKIGDKNYTVVRFRGLTPRFTIKLISYKAIGDVEAAG